jgi:predicted nucleic acid-binding protein
MSGVVVLDASAAIRLVMDTKAQSDLLERIATADEVLAPMLLCAESANVLWKYQRAGVLSDRQALERHTEISILVHRFVDDCSLFPEALQLAGRLNHPVYDVLYLVTARRHAAQLVTFDSRLHSLCKQAQTDSQLFKA